MSDYIPESIQFLILKSLPVKSLLRFRRVSKWWKEHIDSPDFMLEHLAVQKPRFLVDYGGPECDVVDSAAPRLVDTLRAPIHSSTIYGTLHGVVCLCTILKSNLLIWNPSIRKFSRLPPPGDELDWTYASSTCYGFWIDPSSREYKIVVVCFDTNEEDETLDAEGILYSSIRQDYSVISPGERWGYWRPVGDSNSALLIGGVGHWVGHIKFGNDLGLKRNAKVIMSFDFRQQSFDFIEITTPKYSDGSPSFRLCLWRGALSLVCWEYTFPHRCDIYSMKEGSWVNMFGFSLLPSIDAVFWLLEGKEERSGRVLGQGRGVHNPYGSKVILYDPSRAGCIPLTRESNRLNVAVSYDFVESLLFPLV